MANLTELNQTVPNMHMAQGSSGNSTVTVAMRGTASADTSMSQSPTVGIHIDGFYLAKTQGGNMDLEDLERVEVLRGPQGTLFGRNTTGGAINLITKKPSEERSITVSSQVGNYDAFKGRATVNVPLVGNNGFFQSDALGTLSLRQNVVYRSHDAYVDNRSPTGVPTSGASGLNDLNRVLNMTAVRWQPKPNVTVDYAFEYHRFRQAATATQVTHVIPGGPVDATLTVPGVGQIANPNSLVPYVRPHRADATLSVPTSTGSATMPCSTDGCSSWTSHSRRGASTWPCLVGTCLTGNTAPWASIWARWDGRSIPSAIPAPSACN